MSYHVIRRLAQYLEVSVDRPILIIYEKVVVPTLFFPVKLLWIQLLEVIIPLEFFVEGLHCSPWTRRQSQFSEFSIAVKTF